MVGKIYINGLIGSIYDDKGNVSEKGTELIDVIQQVKSYPFADSYEVHINSKGGVVDTGFDIYDYLVGLQKPITTIASGTCASIATIIFMAGNIRKLSNGVEFMIHSPLGKPNNFMNSKQLESFTDELKKIEKRILDFYSKTTSLTSNELQPLLSNETWLDNSQAFDFGFTTDKEVYTDNFQAVAYLNSNINKQSNMNTEFTAEQQTWLEKKFEFIAGLFKGQVVNLALQDANGVEVVFPDLGDSDTPKLEDMATVDGKPAEGTFIFPQMANLTITFMCGKVAEISTPEEEGADNEMMDKLKAENEALKAQLTAMENEKTQAVNTIEEKLKTVEAEFVNFKSEVSSKFQFVAQKNSKEEKGAENIYKEKLAKLKNKK